MRLVPVIYAWLYGMESYSILDSTLCTGLLCKLDTASEFSENKVWLFSCRYTRYLDSYCMILLIEWPGTGAFTLAFFELVCNSHSLGPL